MNGRAPLIEVERGNAGLHLWVGPLGLHLFWPVWYSRFDYLREWRSVPEPLG